MSGLRDPGFETLAWILFIGQLLSLGIVALGIVKRWFAENTALVGPAGSLVSFSRKTGRVATKH